MLKETIICVVIVISIIFGNNVTQSYTKESVSQLTKELMELREDITKQQVNNEEAKNKSEEIYNQWKERNAKLAYFIEHDELEKVETELIAIKSYVESEEYQESVNELDKNIFILQHIEAKYAFNLQNIF
jgi:polyhydroxyalkanoate synthesis regulator phasin